jgi:hypothetical protein
VAGGGACQRRATPRLSDTARYRQEEQRKIDPAGSSRFDSDGELVKLLLPHVADFAGNLGVAARHCDSRTDRNGNRTASAQPGFRDIQHGDHVDRGRNAFNSQNTADIDGVPPVGSEVDAREARRVTGARRDLVAPSFTVRRAGPSPLKLYVQHTG